MAAIGLAEVLSALRTELDQAMSEGLGERVQFAAKSIDLEFQVGVTKSAEGKAGIKFWVVELGAGGTYTSESIQTVRLSLEPMIAKAGTVKIAGGTDESPIPTSQAPTPTQR